MTTHANAPAPHGALFDDAPAYVECVAVWPSGRTQRGRCKRGKLSGVELARLRLADGLCVYVRPEDVEAVTGGAHPTV
jgi:hypothetical protein